MITASNLVWSLAGEPECGRQTIDTPGRCAVCGAYDATPVPVKDAIGTMFASHGELARQRSGTVCRACTWVMLGRPPETIRMWCTVARGDKKAPPGPSEKSPDLGPYVHLTNRADLRWAVETLLQPPDCPWVVLVTTSGKKHILPFTTVNRGAPWAARLETVDVHGTPERLATVLYVAGQLMALGLYGSEILSGNPNTARLVKAGIPAWEAAEKHLGQERGGPMLELAIIALNKEHHDETTERARQELDRRGVNVVGGGLHLGGPPVGRPGCDRAAPVVGKSQDCTGDISQYGGILVPNGEHLRKETAGGNDVGQYQQGSLFDREKTRRF